MSVGNPLQDRVMATLGEGHSTVVLVTMKSDGTANIVMGLGKDTKISHRECRVKDVFPAMERMFKIGE